MQHLIFYDGQCGLCDRIVNFVLLADKEKRFVFAPLQGQTAKRLVPQFTNQLDTLVLIENYQTHPKQYIMAKGAFRICWLLGGIWALPGLLSFLPGWMFDWGYRLVARYRHRLFDQESCRILTRDSDRFLP